MIEASPWQPENKQWMTERKDEWRHVVRNLKELKGDVDVKGHKYHKELFFNGIVTPEIYSKEPLMESKFRSIKIFSFNLLFYRMWYHPEPTHELFRDMMTSDPYEKITQRRNAIDRVRQDIFVRWQNIDFSSSYGMVGGRGREALIVNALFFGKDYKKEADVGNGEKIVSIYPPDFIFSKVVSSLNMIMDGFKTNPYAFGRYMWDHFDFAFYTYPDEVKAENFERRESVLRRGLHLMLDLENQTMEDWRMQNAKEYKNELLPRFEARDFCPDLMKYWDEAKAKYEAGEPAPMLKR